MKPKKNEAKQDFLNRCTQEKVGDGLDKKDAFASCNLDWNKSNNTRNALTLTAPIELKKTDVSDDEPSSFLITAYTGKPIDRRLGSIIFNLSGMQSKSKMPILREHARDRVVGYGEGWADEANFYVKGAFSKITPDAKEVLGLSSEGYPWQASVGIRPKKIKVLESKKESEVVNGIKITGPAEIWEESLVGEVSFVSLGADDDTAAITFYESDEAVPVKIVNLSNQNKEEEEMAITIETLTTEAPELLSQIQNDAKKAGVKEGVELERKRVVEILGADADAEMTSKAIEDGTEATAAYKLFYEAEKANRAKGLEEMEKDATESMGAGDPDMKDEDTRPVDQQLAEKARELAEEKGISISAATKQVFAKNKELAKQWKPNLHE